MRNCKFIVVIVLILSYSSIYAQAQNNDVDMDWIEQDSLVVLSPENSALVNPEALNSFYGKLSALKQGKLSKINIVHIGDSHIQAGFFTREIRTLLQDRFGNGGLGFTFPYKLAHTNGALKVRYSSSVPWKGKRNIFITHPDSVGLSGFYMKTKYAGFGIRLKVMDPVYSFNTLKVFTPYYLGEHSYKLGETSFNIPLKTYGIKNKIHKIRSGENLSVIAHKYGISIKTLKRANHLKSDLIRAGASLKIPVHTQTPRPLPMDKFKVSPLHWAKGEASFHSSKPLDELWLLAGKKRQDYLLNGFWLGKDGDGIIYNGIGVNGARFKDYNKTNLFFNQLPLLHPDLYVISLGTNGANDKEEVEDYLSDLKLFLAHLNSVSPGVPVILTTPPPSLYKRKNPNKYVQEYAKALVHFSEKNPNVTVWDLYTALGSNTAVRSNYKSGLMAGDYVHYTVKGYEYSGRLFVEALLSGYMNYLNPLNQNITP